MPIHAIPLPVSMPSHSAVHTQCHCHSICRSPPMPFIYAMPFQCQSHAKACRCQSHAVQMTTPSHSNVRTMPFFMPPAAACFFLCFSVQYYPFGPICRARGQLCNIRICHHAGGSSNCLGSAGFGKHAGQGNLPSGAPDPQFRRWDLGQGGPSRSLRRAMSCRASVVPFLPKFALSSLGMAQFRTSVCPFV